ncbi:MAG: adenylate/guanylate cyclase domain-containing protein [Arenimonas sp.]
MGEADGSSLLIGGFYGVMLAVIVYHALIYAVVRDASHREFVMAAAAVTLVAMAIDGVGVRYVWGGWPWLASHMPPLALGLAAICTTRFYQVYLQTRSRRALDRLLMATQASGTALSVATFLLPMAWLPNAMRAVMLFASVAQPLVVIAFALAGSRSARFLLLATLVAAIGAQVQTVASMGVLALPPIANHAAFIGAAVAVVLQALGLADSLDTERRERARLSRLRRFFAPQVAQTILAEGGEAQLVPRRRDVTVVFTDLRGFTRFADSFPPDEVMRVLREYHAVVGRLVTRHEGTLEHFAGDGVMIFFNAPLEVADPELRAVRMALDMRDEFERLRVEWAARGYELGVGIGIDRGPATVGRVGTDERWNYAAIGPVTNLAARLCGRAAHGEILVSASLRDRIGSVVTARSLGEQEIKGLPQPVPVFSLQAVTG